MVRVPGTAEAWGRLKASVSRKMVLILGCLVLLMIFYLSCTTRVLPNEFGVEQRKLGLNQGIVPKTYGPGLYFMWVGTTLHTFPREIHVLDASYDQADALSKAGGNSEVSERVRRYFDHRDRILGTSTHRTIDPVNVQTSDGYAVTADVTLLYSIKDPVKIARDFGWGPLYVDSFVINTFRNGLVSTLGKMNADDFYQAETRIKALAEAEVLLRQRFTERGFEVHELLLRNYRYADNYEKSLRDKKVAVQLTEKNRKEALVNEERATLKQIETKGNAAITVAQSEITAKVAKIRAEAELYASQTRAKSDKEVNVAQAESKRLKADALTQAGGRYVVALETAKMFENINGAVMTPEQYISFVRNAWLLIGVNPGTAPVLMPK